MDVISRAAGYLWRFGFRRSLWLLRKKAIGKVPWNIRQPAFKSARYFKDHGAAIAAGPAPARGLFGKPSIAIIGNLNLDQCRKYRVVQKLEAFQVLGAAAQFAATQDVARAVNLMQTASHVIFYRMTDNELFRAYLAEARRLGLGVSYDIDDPIFDEAIYGGSKNMAFLEAGERRHLVGQCASYLSAMRAADRIIVSTPALKDLAEAMTGKPGFVWRNAVDAESRLAASLALSGPRRTKDGTVRIGYASGSRTHEADFSEAEDALVALMANADHVTLEVIGHHRLSPALLKFGGRVTARPYTNYFDYLGHVAGYDINVVPLLQDNFNACKSAIRFLDAAVVGTPTIASRTGDFMNVIEHGRTGLLADGKEAWLPLLTGLVANAGQRRATGQAARAFAETHMAVERVALDLDQALVAELGR